MTSSPRTRPRSLSSSTPKNSDIGPDAVTEPDENGQATGARRFTYPSYTGAVLGLLVLGVYAAITNDSFLTSANLLTVLSQTSIVAVMAAGAALVVITKGIDLAVAAVGALAATTAGVAAVEWGWPGWAAIAVALAVGAVAGAVQGTLIAYVGLPPFIVTLGGLSAWRGLGNHLTGGIANTGMPEAITFLGRQKIIGDLEVPIVLTVVVYALLWVLLNLRRYGIHLYAIGGNESAAENSGVRVQSLKALAYVLAGVLAALGGLIQIGRLDAANGSIMVGLELEVIAAVVIGGISLFGGEGSILGAFFGALFIRVIRNWMNLEGYSAFIQAIVVGCVIVGAVLLDQVRKRATSS